MLVVAPITPDFAQAKKNSMSSWQFPANVATRSPFSNPSSRNARASWFERSSSCVQVVDAAPGTTTASRSP